MGSSKGSRRATGFSPLFRSTETKGCRLGENIVDFHGENIGKTWETPWKNTYEWAKCIGIIYYTINGGKSSMNGTMGIYSIWKINDFLLGSVGFMWVVSKDKVVPQCVS